MLRLIEKSYTGHGGRQAGSSPKWRHCSAGGTKHALDEWSTVEDVRTGIQNRDPEMLHLAEKLERLFALVHSKGLEPAVKRGELSA
jgi:hypothetical protein